MRRDTILVAGLVFVAAIAVGVWWSACRPPAESPSFTRVILHQAAETLLYLPLHIVIDQGLSGR